MQLPPHGELRLATVGRAYGKVTNGLIEPYAARKSHKWFVLHAISSRFMVLAAAMRAYGFLISRKKSTSFTEPDLWPYHSLSCLSMLNCRVNGVAHKV